MSTVQTMQLFCLSDPDYYDTPDRLADTTTRYALDGAPVPPGWRRSRRGLWTHLRPQSATLPEQGWKIHLSTVPDRAEATLEAVAAVCVPRTVGFKFLRSADALLFANGKHMTRASSGKFVTVYPADDRQFGEVLDALVAALDGSPGPYILSDLRIGRGPVYVRYGAFVEQWCAEPGRAPVPALRDPSGVLVPDERGPVFRTPAWIQPPAALRPHLAARRAAGDPGFPYRVLRPLHFTNAGGTYLAEHRETGQKVVLREARPHSGLDGTGTDAVTRLRREYDALSKLDGLDCVPRVFGMHTVWEHQFLVEEYVEGLSLLRAVIYRNPLRFVDPPAEALTEYVRWVEKIVDGLSRALDALHALGISFGDLHPGNVIVRPDDSVVLIDFEYAGDADASGHPRVGAPGYTAPREATGAEADRYSLRATWLSMLMPLAELAEHDTGKTATVEALARRVFGLGSDAGPPLPAIRGTSRPRRGGGENVVAELFDGPEVDWPAIREQLAAGIMRSATPDRTDRLFPADPHVFDGQGAAFAYGAAGVLLALHRTGTAVAPEHVDWLLAAARRCRRGPGLFDGLHGVAAALHTLGRPDEALEVLSRCRGADPAPVPGLFSGQAGVALGQCRFAQLTGDDALLGEATRTAERLDVLARDGQAGPLALPPTAGLLHGMTGSALLQLRLHRITGEVRFLEAARRALAHELGHCVAMEDGTVQVRSGHRHLLYIDGGSGGIALAAAEYLTHREDAELAAFIQAVRPGCGHWMVREPGLFQGRAGLLAVLGRLSGPAVSDQAVRAQVRRLAWYAVHRDGALLIPGRRLRRLSADVATGSAGVLLALHSVFDGGGEPLPLLLPGW